MNKDQSALQQLGPARAVGMDVHDQIGLPAVDEPMDGAGLGGGEKEVVAVEVKVGGAAAQVGCRTIGIGIFQDRDFRGGGIRAESVEKLRGGCAGVRLVTVLSRHDEDAG